MSEVISVKIAAVALRVTGIELSAVAEAIAAVAAERLSAQAHDALKNSIVAVPTRLDSIAPAPAPALTAHIGAGRLEPQEARLVGELASVATLSVADSRRLEQTLRSRPVEEWAGIIRSEHQQLFCRRLSEAVARACRKMDFTAIQPGQNRLVAEDADGRALAVQMAADGSLQAEVLGIADGSCRAVLDRFLRKLAEEGVQIAQIKERRWTGGAPNTETGLRWSANKMARRTGKALKAGAQAADRRLKPTQKPQARIGR